jgi:hypothetical protein
LWEIQQNLNGTVNILDNMIEMGLMEESNDSAVMVNCMVPVISPDYDPSRVYMARSARPGWHIVRLIGIVAVLNGEKIAPGWKHFSGRKAPVGKCFYLRVISIKRIHFYRGRSA